VTLPAALFLQVALMVVLPILFWGLAARRVRLGRYGWAVIGYGGLFYVLSRIGMWALQLLAVALGVGTVLPQVLVFGLSGVVEGLFRYLGMGRVSQVREGLDRRTATMFGLGFGGFESILLGLVTLATALILSNAGPNLPPVLVAQGEIWAVTPSYVFLFGIVERLIAIALNVSLSLMVARAILAGSTRQLALALAANAFAEGGKLALQRAFGYAVVTEGYLAIVAGLTLIYGAATRDSSDRDLGTPVGDPTGGGVSDSEVVGAGRS
jgi:uncharacterized membrane protein YhfC